nr:integrase, catalytic region, zinc finger, CCHC-type, peptidase aspartic, catalytic [Tanacetum cinerariifolium]
MLTCRKTNQVWSHPQNSREAGVSKDMSGPELIAPSRIHTLRRANSVLSYFQLGDEELSSRRTKLNYIFITAEDDKHDCDYSCECISVNGKKYIFVIADDYSRFTWVKFLRSKDETSDFIIKFLKMIQVTLKVPVRRIRTNNRTEFVNQTLCDYYEEVGISHETSVARSSQQNGVVERQAVATACFTQNRSIIRLRHGKTPYELLHSKLPDLSFFHVFGALCYPTNDSENLGKLQPKADIEIFIGYAPTKKSF